MPLSDHQAAPSAPAIPATAVMVRLPLDDLTPSALHGWGLPQKKGAA